MSMCSMWPKSDRPCPLEDMCPKIPYDLFHCYALDPWKMYGSLSSKGALAAKINFICSSF